MRATPITGLTTAIDCRSVPPARRRRKAASNSPAIPGPDLCDGVIQQPFAIGLAMRTTQQRCGNQPAVTGRITKHMNDLQHVIQQIRSTVLVTPGPVAESPGKPVARQKSTGNARDGRQLSTLRRSRMT